MVRYFNTEGSCNPKKHYMVSLAERLSGIKNMLVDRKKYFVINKGRQYGKTTTLRALEDYLREDYLVLSLDFQQLGAEDFADGSTFACAFAEKALKAFTLTGISSKEEFLHPLAELTKNGENKQGLKELFEHLSIMCAKAPKAIVLMIDEVDSAGNNQVFIEFLAQLRSYYLQRDKQPTFHSVILAGVYSIKNLKLKLRPESEHQYISPWNIAAEFKIDMSFSPAQIAGMLKEYEADHHTEMDIRTVSQEIYDYTSGYPVLVSSICKCIDEDICGEGDLEDPRKTWSKEGVERAVALILKRGPLLFESMAKQLDRYPDLYKIVEDIIYCGKKIPFSLEEKSINLGSMFGFLKEENGHVAIANRMFEMCLLNMDLVLKKFVSYFTEIYGSRDERFIEKQGRKIFLIYLKPIIIGTGNYYMEAQTRDERRTDVIVDYLGEQFIVKLKIWHGEEYNERGEKQLTDYLEYYHKDKGYMLSFNFNKNKKVGVQKIRVGGKTIVEAVV